VKQQVTRINWVFPISPINMNEKGASSNEAGARAVLSGEIRKIRLIRVTCLTAYRKPSRLLAILTCALAAACSDLSAPGDDLAGARRRWDAWGPRTYEVTIHRSCYCLAETGGPVVVSVRDGEIQSRVYVQTGAPVAERFTRFFTDVPGLFASIEEAVAQGSTVEVRYDAATGAPLEIIVDRESWPVDGGYGLYVKLVAAK
jgi:hypothetical protein